ncbi:MAG: hypothetical protein JSV62_08905 [Promethearchaeota archaeon]|nr:MAG: hypothetical protein JSV62_08905 [Candidatus Lokiarchaeota archaeon]
MNYYPLDLILFFIINSANILVSVIFISRVKKPRFERILGLFYILLSIPTIIITIINISFQREWWFWIFPLLFLIFIAFEFIIDYVKKVEFRNPRNKKILVPYLILYYISIILMWGLTWTLGILYGAITGITYFLQLGCAIYAGKHGVG